MSDPQQPIVTFSGKAPSMKPALWVNRRNLLKAFLAGGMTVYVQANQVKGEVWLPYKKQELERGK